MATWALRVCALMVTGMLLVASWNGAVENDRFDRVGERALIQPFAEYTETTTVKTKLGIETGRSTSQSAMLTFTMQGGQQVTVNRNLPDDVFAKFAAGEPVYMEYLPDSPTTTRFEGRTARPFLLALLGLAAAFGTYFFWKRM
jgi:hypothetical protein